MERVADTVLGRTYIRQSPSNTTALEGTQVMLKCRAESSPSNITYQWYRDDVNVQLMNGRHRDDDDDDDGGGGGGGGDGDGGGGEIGRAHV